jgi:ketosteroid isomerase-like protein
VPFIFSQKNHGEEVWNMADEKTATIIRDFLRALEARDPDRVMSFFVEDSTWVAPEGTFKGKLLIRSYLGWQFGQARDIKITERGNGIVAQGNQAFVEHVISGTLKGVKAEYLALCAYELKDDKIREVRAVYDRLSLAKQVARGWLPKWLVGQVAKWAERGSR